MNEHPVYVNERSYEQDQVVLTLKTNENGIAATEANALPYGHYRIEETHHLLPVTLAKALFPENSIFGKMVKS
ncbi:MAG: hypothetical protein ACLTER_11190 [Ruminococcus sp.]